MSKREGGALEGGEDKMEIIPLGAGSEVGRSCVYLTYKGKHLLFDCGIHPAYSGMAGLPFFDEIDPSVVDVLLVTHFHLDHAASLPYFLRKTSFKGRVFMTHATKAVYKLLLSDFIKVSKVSAEDSLFDESDILKSMEKIEVIDFHQSMEVNGIKFWCYTAGHVLGAAMFMVDIAGIRVLYTGDYSREEDRHLRAAELPPFSPEVCIIESTYGVQVHAPRRDRERRFTDVISQTVLNGGRVLIPAFALGRAQELLLILDEYWAAHPELHQVPIYYASPLAKKCMAVYQTYINSMNDNIRQKFEISNPFNFKHIQSLKSIEHFKDTGPSVVMASPGGLQSGLSRQLFDTWCQDKRNAVVVPGYVVEGTLAKTILHEPKEITLSSGKVVPLRMRVHYISFSAHADFLQTSDFLEQLRPPNVILVHGEANEMGRLKGKLVTQFEKRETKILTPKNCQTVELFFKGEKTAKGVGRLADVTPKEGTIISGLLVKKGFSYQIMAPEDLQTYTQLSTGRVTQRQSVPYSGSFTVLKYRLQQMFEGVEEVAKAELPTIQVLDNVTVAHASSENVILNWESDPTSDMIADSVVATIMHLNTQSARLTASSSDESVQLEELGGMKEVGIVKELLAGIYGRENVQEGPEELRVSVDGVIAVVARMGSGGMKQVTCSDEGLRSRISLALKRIHTALHPLKL
eukprot:SM000146S00949  [mRNA]  locus=s146:90575:95748:+ [translate_table: standard]